MFQKQLRWLLDRPVNPRIKSGEGDDTYFEAVTLRDLLTSEWTVQDAVLQTEVL
jgi:hypothetical protein